VDESATPLFDNYSRIGGRARARHTLSLDTQVRAVGSVDRAAVTVEHAQILELLANRWLSVAEIAAHLHTTMNVIRVHLSDLLEERLVAIGAPSGRHGRPSREDLQKVINHLRAM
jgi:DNA-binding transcriptional ArsR family regulator